MQGCCAVPQEHVELKLLVFEMVWAAQLRITCRLVFVECHSRAGQEVKAFLP